MKKEIALYVILSNDLEQGSPAFKDLRTICLDRKTSFFGVQRQTNKSFFLSHKWSDEVQVL